jgi:UDP-N-acetylglucosamine diphosphorylase/glucosamine-1-phosphate N-acetyltransferase
MQYILFEDGCTRHLRPMTSTRPVYALRVGIDTVSEKWARHLGEKPQQLCHGAARHQYNTFVSSDDAVLINGKYLPTPTVIEAIRNLPPKKVLITGRREVLAFRGETRLFNSAHFQDIGCVELKDLLNNYPQEVLPAGEEPLAIRQLTDIFRINGEVLRRDFSELTAGRTSAPITDPHTRVYGAENIFLEEGVTLRAAVLNAEKGPIYLGKGVDIQEGAIIGGGHAILEGSAIMMGAILRGDSTIGPQCKIGGEVANSVIQGFSNKSHHGYLGNSVLGKWVNIGAGTSISNLKNNYSTVDVYDVVTEKYVDTHLQFCGVFIGDYTKLAINTRLNTGTVLSVGCNVFTGDFPAKFVEPFTWGCGPKSQPYEFSKFVETAERMMHRRGLQMSPEHHKVLKEVFAITR